MFEFNSFRGARSYLRAADIMAAIPLPEETLSFQFFFRQVATVPGVWVRQGVDRRDPAATLSLKLPERTDFWEFHTDPRVTARRTENIDKSAILTNLQLQTDRAVCALTDQYSLWDQIVAAARAGGEVVFPGYEWILVHVGGNANAVRKSYNNRELELTIARRRGRLVELNFAIDGKPAGRVGIVPK